MEFEVFHNEKYFLYFELHGTQATSIISNDGNFPIPLGWTIHDLINRYGNVSYGNYEIPFYYMNFKDPS